ncbi:YitT family protein [Caldibacillus sp. 210928-DFI.2.22]|uniref:YitT family protein n=1 Tax=unclassified Caldibacillus TaxID=2641266 RepID=UPI001D090487|nr:MULTISPECIES: YitT family protein [unclassified Caldibacillus]MCB7070972.1 YitT family protein [Caldibacillus sp. 210928-DFI.2.22]MCB7074474.1 YitT family protein [Caldibacillus sp. 210928-DFI.2.18]
MSDRYQEKNPFKEIFQNYIFITIGAIIFAYGLETFLVPNQVIDGGVVGISLILDELIVPIPFSIFLVVLNIPFLFIGYKQIGKSFAFQSLYGIILASIFTELFHHVEPITDDPLLAAIFGGIVLGVGVGTVLRNNGALDGTEILATLISSKTSFSVGQVVMIFNIFILGSAGFVFSIDSTFYSLIAYFIAFKVIDIVIVGMNESKSVLIVSDKYKEIGEALLNRLGRTVTYFTGEGGYSGEEKKVIYCVITRLEEAKLKTIVRYFDPNAFLAMSDVSDVKGGQFKKKSIH